MTDRITKRKRKLRAKLEQAKRARYIRIKWKDGKVIVTGVGADDPAVSLPSMRAGLLGPEADNSTEGSLYALVIKKERYP